MSLREHLYNVLSSNATIKANVGSKRPGPAQSKVYAIGNIQAPSQAGTPAITFKVNENVTYVNVGGEQKDTGHRTGRIDIEIEVAPAADHGEKLETLANTILDLMTSTTFIKEASTYNVGVRSCRLSDRIDEDGNAVPGREPNHKYTTLLFDVGFFDTERLLS